MTDESVSNYADPLLIFIVSSLSQYVFWPSGEERSVVARELYAQYGIPSCVGVIDGTDIVLHQAPLIEREKAHMKHSYSYMEKYGYKMIAVIEATYLVFNALNRAPGGLFFWVQVPLKFLCSFLEIRSPHGAKHVADPGGNRIFEISKTQLLIFPSASFPSHSFDRCTSYLPLVQFYLHLIPQDSSLSVWSRWR